MQGFISFLADIISLFWSAFIDIYYYPISFGFFLSLVGLAVFFIMWFFFREGKAVM